MALAGQLRNLGARRGLTLVGSGFVGNAQSQELALLHRPKTHFKHAIVIAILGCVVVVVVVVNFSARIFCC